MNAKKLQGLFNTLNTRINDHRSELVKSEALTRYALVDPLLRELGWDTGDPGQVQPEYPLDDGRADYVLSGDDPDKSGFFLETKRVLLIEAKKLTGKEDDPEKELWEAALQALLYASSDKVRYFAATDGQRWHVYDREKEGGLENGRISCFDLTDEKKAVKACEQAKQLWRSTWHIEFMHGWRVDADGAARSPENGEEKDFKRRRPRGTRWILRGRGRGKFKYLDTEGWVLTDRGNRSSNFEHPCPPNTKNIVDGKFLDAKGKEIRPKGRRR